MIRSLKKLWIQTKVNTIPKSAPTLFYFHNGPTRLEWYPQSFQRFSLYSFEIKKEEGLFHSSAVPLALYVVKSLGFLVTHIQISHWLDVCRNSSSQVLCTGLPVLCFINILFTTVRMECFIMVWNRNLRVPHYNFVLWLVLGYTYANTCV